MAGCFVDIDVAVMPTSWVPRLARGSGALTLASASLVTSGVLDGQEPQRFLSKLEILRCFISKISLRGAHAKPTEASVPPRVQRPVEEAESSGDDSLARDSLALRSFSDVGNGNKVHLVLEPGVSSHRRLWGFHTLSKREPREAGRSQDRLALLGL